MFVCLDRRIDKLENSNLQIGGFEIRTPASDQAILTFFSIKLGFEDCSYLIDVHVEITQYLIC
jgi:hypothetical protein